MMGKAIGVAMSCLALGAGTLLPVQAQKQKARPFEAEVVPLARKYCLTCHSGKQGAGGIDLSAKTTEQAQARQAVWEKAAQNLKNKHMPPKGTKQPTAKERQSMVAAIESTLAAACELSDPGRVTIRRLNRDEYNNTVRDLVGVEFRPADDFPSDDVGYGFDNIGDVLSISPLLMEKYLSAAEEIADRAIVLPSKGPIRVDLASIPDGQGYNASDRTGKLFYSNATVEARVRIPRDGNYQLRSRAWGMRAGPDLPKLAFVVDGKVIAQLEVSAQRANPTEYEAPVRLTTGTHRVGVAFTNDYYQPQKPEGQRDRNLAVETLEVVGPSDAGALPASHLRIIPYIPPADKQERDARKMLGAFATRAFRRPATQGEVDRLMKVYEAGKQAKEPFERCIQLGVTAVLASPNFLFRVELDDKPNDPKASRALNDYEVASRLSYFLWSTMPDAELFGLAQQKTLRQPAVLKQQVARMLKDPKARALADNFAAQWLQLRKLSAMAPDPKQFPAFDEELRRAMAEETKLYFMDVVRNDRSVLEFLDSRFAYVNGPLAKLYGIDGVDGPELRKVALEDPNRGGLLTQASVLTVTSNPTRTSPTKRGKWVLEEILGTPPPPPPPGVSNLGEDEKKLKDTISLRELMKMHREKADCASCHNRMDPLGFGLENFGPIGEWRTTEGKFEVDATGELADGRKFTGPAELKKILLAQKGQFVRCLSEKLLTYALGRGLEAYDKCAIDDASKAAVGNGYRFSAVVTAIVLSEPFLKRRGDGAKR